MLAGLQILLVGILVVMAVLIVLWAACSAIGMAFKAAEAAKARPNGPKATTAAAVAAPAVTDPTAIPPHHLAAITAAAALCLDRPVRILRVQVPPLPASHWVSHGRMQSFTSERRQSDWGSAILDLAQAHHHSRPE